MARSGEVVSHWHHSVESFSVSPLEFYEAVKAELEANKAPVRFDRVEWSEGGIHTAKRTYLRVEFNRFMFEICAAPFGTSFFFSWWLTKRTSSLAAALGCLTLLAMPLVFLILIMLLGVTKGLLLFLVLAGAAFFGVHSAVADGSLAVEDSILAVPVVGPLYQRYFRPVTYYSIDSQIMFQDVVHGAVLKVIEGLLSAKGARALSPEQTKPRTRDVLGAYSHANPFLAF